MKDPVDILAKKLETITTNGNDPTCVTYVINEEDDTLGNALRYVISSYKEVELCQYTRPHPTEDCIHFRIQTYGKMPGNEQANKNSRLYYLLSIGNIETWGFEL